MFNVGLQKFEVFRTDHEWVVDLTVINEPVVKLLSNRTMPPLILKLLEEAMESTIEFLVSKDWANDFWLFYSNETVITFDSQPHSYQLKYSDKISAFFYSPLDSQLYAVSGKRVSFFYNK